MPGRSIRLLPLLVVMAFVMGLSAQSFAADTVAVMKVSADGGDEAALADALKSASRSAGLTLAPKGGDVTIEDVQLVVDCEDATPECLDQVADFLSSPSIIYGSINESGEAKVSWYEKGVGFVRAVAGPANNAEEANTLASRLIEGETGKLVVSAGEQAGAEVVLDGQPVGITPFEETVKVGGHTVMVRKAGYLDSDTRKIEVREGQTTKLDFTLEEDPDAVVTRGMTTTTLVGWIFTGVGGAAMIGATVTGVMMIQKEDEVDELVGDNDFNGAVDARDTGETLATTSNILWGVGGALVVTGVTLVIIGYMDDGEPSDTDEQAFDVNFGVMPGGAAASVGFTF